MLTKNKAEELYRKIEIQLYNDGYHNQREFKNEFSRIVRFVRTRYGMTRKEFSRYLGLSYYCIMSWESGNVMPRLDKLMIFSEKVGQIKIIIKPREAEINA